jgi:hypothetical protein
MKLVSENKCEWQPVSESDSESECDTVGVRANVSDEQEWMWQWVTSEWEWKWEWIEWQRVDMAVKVYVTDIEWKWEWLSESDCVNVTSSDSDRVRLLVIRSGSEWE